MYMKINHTKPTQNNSPKSLNKNLKAFFLNLLKTNLTLNKKVFKKLAYKMQLRKPFVNAFIRLVYNGKMGVSDLKKNLRQYIQNHIFKCA